MIVCVSQVANTILRRRSSPDRSISPIRGARRLLRMAALGQFTPQSEAKTMS